MLLWGSRRRVSSRKGRSTAWFSGSKGSPPNSVSPSIQAGSRLFQIFSATASSKGWPASKSQASALKHPGQCTRHPLTKSVVRTPTPLAMSQYLMFA